MPHAADPGPFQPSLSLKWAPVSITSISVFSRFRATKISLSDQSRPPAKTRLPGSETSIPTPCGYYLFSLVHAARPGDGAIWRAVNFPVAGFWAVAMSCHHAIISLYRINRLAQTYRSILARRRKGCGDPPASQPLFKPLSNDG